MARHRIERQPRHRAQRPARERRRVRFLAVTTPSAGHARPGAPHGVRVPWQAIGASAADRLIAVGVRLLPYQKRLLSGAGRRLVVSPWFAAGAGIVVATGAFIVAPHAQLSFGNPLIARSPCTALKCHHAAPLGGAPPVPAGGGVGQVTPSPTAAPTPPIMTDLTFQYSVTWRTRDMFQMVLTVTSKKAIRTWQLSFVIPGAADVKVSNADWQPSGTDGGTARSTTFGGGPVGAPSVSPSAGATVDDNPVSAEPDVISLVVTGNGTPAAPQGCSFDGTGCHFSPG